MNVTASKAFVQSTVQAQSKTDFIKIIPLVNLEEKKMIKSKNSPFSQFRRKKDQKTKFFKFNIIYPLLVLHCILIFILMNCSSC